jgi:hypothetical protein
MVVRADPARAAGVQRRQHGFDMVVRHEDLDFQPRHASEPNVTTS